jgi:hypothetical protein
MDPKANTRKTQLYYLIQSSTYIEAYACHALIKIVKISVIFCLMQPAG